MYNIIIDFVLWLCDLKSQQHTKKSNSLFRDNKYLILSLYIHLARKRQQTASITVITVPETNTCYSIDLAFEPLSIDHHQMICLRLDSG